jgi:hypothetical protein
MKSLIHIELKNRDLEEIEFNSSDFKAIENQNIIFSIFSNYRDVKRFLNTFLQKNSTVSILVDFKDYFFVQLLKYFYRQEYDDLKNTPFNELFHKYVKDTPEFKSHDCLKIIQQLFFSGKSNSKSFYNEDMLGLYFLDGISDEIKINAQIKESLNSENKELKKIIKLWLLNINKVPNILYKIKRNENFKNYETVLKFTLTIKYIIDHEGYEEEDVIRFLEKLLFQIEKNNISKLLNDLNSTNQTSLGLIKVNNLIIKIFAYNPEVGDLYETQLKLFQNLFKEDSKNEIGQKIYLIFRTVKLISNNAYKNYGNLWSKELISIPLIKNTSEVLVFLKSKNSLQLLNKKENNKIESKEERFFPSDFMEDFNIVYLSQEFVDKYLLLPKEYIYFKNDILRIYITEDNQKLQVIKELINSYE